MTPEQKIHPGRILVRELKERGLTQKQLAEMLSRPEKWVCELAVGRKSVVAESALDLELALEIPAKNWMMLQAEYDLEQARQSYFKVLKKPKPKKAKGPYHIGKIDKSKEAVIALSKNYSPKQIADMLGFSESGVTRALERWVFNEQS